MAALPEEYDIEIGETCNAKSLIIPGDEEIEYISQFIGINEGSNKAPPSVSEEVPQVGKCDFEGAVRFLVHDILLEAQAAYFNPDEFPDPPGSPKNHFTMFMDIRNLVRLCMRYLKRDDYSPFKFISFDKQDELYMTRLIVERLRSQGRIQRDCYRQWKHYIDLQRSR